MTISLPEPLTRYFAEDNLSRPGSLEGLFTTDATVQDEGHTYRGLKMIVAWRRDAKAKYQYTVEPLHFTQQDETVILVARAAGNFPGSPVELTYTFVLADGKIASLEVH